MKIKKNEQSKKKKSKQAPDHVYKGYNRRANMKLGFKTDKEYTEFCKYIVELYEDNEQLTIQSLCDFVQKEHGIMLYYEKARRILHKRKANLREPASERYERRTTSIRISIKQRDYEYIKHIDTSFEGKHMRRAYLTFAVDLIRGNPTQHFILWLSELKPVTFIYNGKTLKYSVFGDDLSDLESNILEELLGQVEEVGNLKPVKAYAESKKLMYWGDNL